MQELPDGRYEIEYVLGDANTRSILRVDVRGGEATIPDEEFDEGLLRLKRLPKQGAEEDSSDDATLGTPLPEETLPDAAAAPLGANVSSDRVSSFPPSQRASR